MWRPVRKRAPICIREIAKLTKRISSILEWRRTGLRQPEAEIKYWNVSQHFAVPPSCSHIYYMPTPYMTSLFNYIANPIQF